MQQEGAQTLSRGLATIDRHCYPWTREDLHFCREHNEHYMRWVRFKAGEIPCSENGCVEGSCLNPREEPVVREHE